MFDSKTNRSEGTPNNIVFAINFEDKIWQKKLVPGDFQIPELFSGISKHPNRNTSKIASYRSANLQTWDWMTQRSFMFLNKKSIPPSCHWKDLLKLSMASLSGRGSMSGQCWAFRTSTWSFDWLGRSASPIKWSSNEWVVVSQLPTLCSVRR